MRRPRTLLAPSVRDTPLRNLAARHRSPLLTPVLTNVCVLCAHHAAWYEKCVSHARAQHALGLGAQNLYDSLHNLGLAQKNAGLLELALVSYEASIAMGYAAAATSKLTLEKTIRQWQGNCGEYPRGATICN